MEHVHQNQLTQEQSSEEPGRAMAPPAFQLMASGASGGGEGSPLQLQEGDAVTAIPEGGTDINLPGVVAWDGSPILRLRSSPSTNSNDNVSGFLPFNTRMEVLKEFPGDWYFVSTVNGLTGYVSKIYVKTNLPEPNARLHKVEGGQNGFAQSIARQYFGDYADDWGQDERFYVNVLAFVNGISVPDTTDGWRSVHFQADDYIWIPDYQFARGLIGVVNSGSASWNVADSVGLAGFADSVEAKLRDFQTAIHLSRQYIGEAVAHYAEEGILNALRGLATMLIGGAAVLAVTTAIGAGLGALAGGVGAAPGAALGFEAGLALLEWLGLGFLIAWVGQKVIEIGGAFGQFIGTVWGADGDQQRIDQAAQEFADAVGRLCGAVIEGLVMFGAAKGVRMLFSTIRGTQAGRKFERTNTAGRWLSDRATNVRSGASQVRSPGAVLNPLIGRFQGLKNGRVSDVLPRIPSHARMRRLTPVEGRVTQGVEYTWVQEGVTWRVRIHGPDPGAPPGSHSAQGWIFRVQQGSRYMDPNGTFHSRGVLNEGGPLYDAILANETHIPIVRDVAPSSLQSFHSNPGTALPTDTETHED